MNRSVIMESRLKNSEYYKAISVKKMREGDAYTIRNFVSSKELMLRAAYGVYNSVNWKGKAIAIVAGSGNNGGDGYALATILADHGMIPHIYRTSEKFSDDGLYYYNLALEKDIPTDLFSESQDFSMYDIVVDCILGTGFTGIPRGLAADAIIAINNSSAFIVSVDINSGMNGDSGEAELAVKSDLTVSIGYYKTGLFLGKAPELIDDLVNVDIGIVFEG